VHKRPTQTLRGSAQAHKGRTHKVGTSAQWTHKVGTSAQWTHKVGTKAQWTHKVGKSAQ